METPAKKMKTPAKKMKTDPEKRFKHTRPIYSEVDCGSANYPYCCGMKPAEPPNKLKMPTPLTSAEKSTLICKWFNLTFSGTRAWYTNPSNGSFEAGDIVMAKALADPAGYGEQWDEEWIGPFLVGATTDGYRVHTLLWQKTESFFITSVPNIEVKLYVPPVPTKSDRLIRFLKSRYQTGRCLQDFAVPEPPRISQQICKL